MKNRVKHTLPGLWLTVLFLTVFGCKSLEEEPDFISPGSFYSTSADALAALNGAYKELNGEWFNHTYNRSVFDCLLGMQSGYEKGPQYFQQGGYVASDDYISTYWAQNYRGINRCNIVLEKVPAIKMDEALKKRVLAEAHFLRAFYYYTLVIYYDNIPVSEKPTRQIGEYISNENGKQKALDLIAKDLAVAETDLEASYTGNDLGRPTKWTAKALLAKSYLESGSWQLAADKAKEVMDQSNITLFPDFADNFRISAKNRNERMFEVQVSYAANPGVNQNLHAHFTPTDWDGGDGVTPGDNSTAAGWADAWIVGAVPLRQSFDPTDKRIPATFLDKYRSKNAKGEVVTFDPNAKSLFVAPGSPERTFRNVYFAKYIEQNIGNWDRTEKNIPLIRYADVLLTHSEAVSEGATGDAYRGINLIRNRAGLAPLSGLSQTALRDAILNEWLKEFAGEGWAFPHVKRKGKVAQFIKQYTGRDVDNAKFSVLPIPLVEINTNSNVKQNQGW